MLTAIDLPRTVEFSILRTCERLSIPPSDFLTLDHQEQIQLLAYNSIRQTEELQTSL